MFIVWVAVGGVRGLLSRAVTSLYTKWRTDLYFFPQSTIATHRKCLYTCLHANLPIQYIWLNDWSYMCSSITLICSFRISHQILCTTFRKHSMNLILKLFVFDFAENVYTNVYTLTSLSNTFDLMTDQICPLVSLWSVLSEYHIRFYVRPSESTLWIWFWNYSCLDFA